VFIKLDLRWGYNNIRIKEEDEWKVVFMIPMDLYEPIIMFFELTNLPATFYVIINDILRSLINKDSVSL